MTQAAGPFMSYCFRYHVLLQIEICEKKLELCVDTHT